jgi:hypothetical protein
MSSPIPPFSELPLRNGDPPYSAWGLYGSDDERGTLNRLTKDIVLQAKEEIQTGETISLNLPLDALAKSNVIGRQGFEMKQYAKLPRIVCDDVWTFNSQGSTQWDGLRHWADQKTGQFYNDRTLDDFFNEDKSIRSNVNGIQNWEKTGIVGRGILLDFERWRRVKKIDFNPLPLSPHPITLDQLKEVAKFQETEIKFGDILFIRTGFNPAYQKLSLEDKAKIGTLWQSSGIVQSEETLEWIWNNFSAVAGDGITFEVWRKCISRTRCNSLQCLVLTGETASKQDWYMHDVLLAGWGMPLGELFDLERAAEYCEKINRWSFFVSSEVCSILLGHVVHC